MVGCKWSTVGCHPPRMRTARYIPSLPLGSARIIPIFQKYCRILYLFVCLSVCPSICLSKITPQCGLVSYSLRCGLIRRFDVFEGRKIHSFVFFGPCIEVFGMGEGLPMTTQTASLPWLDYVRCAPGSEVECGKRFNAAVLPTALIRNFSPRNSDLCGPMCGVE